MKLFEQPTRYFRGSMTQRIVAIAVATALATAIAVGTVGYVLVRNVERLSGEAALASDLRHVTDAMDRSFARVRQDLMILGKTPPIQGLARTLENQSVDPVDGTSTAEDWKGRLAEIFESFFSIRPDYLQIRYIELNNDGREIVRVDRTSQGIRRITGDDLQRKDGEPYFQIASTLGPGQTHVTNATWNREHGVIQEPRLAVVRYIVPVFDENGRRFGMIVINTDAVPFMNRALRNSGIERHIVLVGSTGNRFVFTPESMKGELDINSGSDPLTEMPDSVFEAGDSMDFATSGDFAVVRSTYDGITSGGGGAIQIAVVEERAVLEQNRRTASTILAIAAVLLTILATFLTRFFSNRTIAPLAALNTSIMEATRSGKGLDLPVGRTDEIGQISRSFAELIQLLETRKNRAGMVFNGVSDGVIIADTDGIIQDVNPAVCEMFGYSRGEMMGKNLSILMFGKEQVEYHEQIATYLDTGVTKSMFRTVERVGRHRDGSELPIELTVSEIVDDREHYFAGIMRDISERHAENRERARLIAALEASNEELESFAYVASHDLKAPLRTIHNATTWIVEDLDGRMNGEMEKNIELLRSRASRMERLLDDLLAHSKIGRKTGETVTRCVSGLELAVEVESLVHLKEGFTLTFSSGFNEIIVDEMPLALVLANLVSNAVKHHDRTDGNVSISASRVGDRYRFDVADDGPGIEPRYHGKIFQLFSTLQARDRVEGSGMGLAIVAKHVSVMGGSISVASNGDGTGSVFTFNWPAAKPERDTGGPERSVA